MSVELGITYLVVSAISLWCYVLIVTGGHDIGWKLAGGALAPVFLWTGARMLSTLELSPDVDDPLAHAPARLWLRLSLAALAVLALLVAAD